MARGTIKKLFADRGFGSIRTEEGQYIFFHRNDLQGVAYESLTLGQEVEFEMERPAKGPNARHVRLAGGSS
jgi:CspA family cold shock protein